MNPIIEFCISNLASGGYEALEIFEEDPNLDVVEYGCLDHCGLCGESLYVLVNGEVVTGTSPKNLVEKVYKYIEENPMF